MYFISLSALSALIGLQGCLVGLKKRRGVYWIKWYRSSYSDLSLLLLLPHLRLISICLLNMSSFSGSAIDRLLMNLSSSIIGLAVAIAIISIVTNFIFCVLFFIFSTSKYLGTISSSSETSRLFIMARPDLWDERSRERERAAVREVLQERSHPWRLCNFWSGCRPGLIGNWSPPTPPPLINRFLGWTHYWRRFSRFVFTPWN